jgi:hypothetical protein
MITNTFINDNNKLLIIRIRRTEKKTQLKNGDNVFLYRKKMNKNYPDIGEIGENFQIIMIDSNHNVWVKRTRDGETFRHPIHKNYFCRDVELRDTRLDYILNNL